MADVTLSAAVRDSLLSLQNTTNLIDRTQGRLSTGLKVSSAIDDPVAFFQSKTLNDRAFDFTEKKDSIDQGISTVTAALDGVEAIEALVRQLKGIANSLKSATTTQFSELLTQFSDLRSQINNLTADTSFQGTNLVNGTGVTLNVEFSDRSASILNIASVDLTVATGGLNIDTLTNYTGQLTGSNAALSDGARSASEIVNSISAGSVLAITYGGLTNTFTAGATTTVAYGTGSVTVNVGGTQTISAGTVVNITFSSGSPTAGFYIGASTTVNLALQASATVSAQAGGQVSAGDTFNFTYQGATRTFTTADNGVTLTAFGAGAGTGVFTVNISGGSVVLTNGAKVTAVFASAGDTTVGANRLIFELSAGNRISAADIGNGTQITAIVGFVNTGATAFAASTGIAGTTTLVRVSDSTQINSVIDGLDSALATLRSQAQTLGTNVALLQTRLEFTEAYVNTLEEGSAKLVLADVNEEGANLLALQTRQQLGIQALAFAGQAEQSILSLFR